MKPPLQRIPVIVNILNFLSYYRYSWIRYSGTKIFLEFKIERPLIIWLEVESVTSTIIVRIDRFEN